MDELEFLKVEQVGLELLLRPRDRLEYAIGEVSADDRCFLHGALESGLEPVHAGRHYAPDGIGHLDIGGLIRERPLVVLSPNVPVVNQRTYELLQGQGVSRRLGQDQLSQLRHCVSLFQDGLHQVRTRLR